MSSDPPRSRQPAGRRKRRHPAKRARIATGMLSVAGLVGLTGVLAGTAGSITTTAVLTSASGGTADTAAASTTPTTAAAAKTTTAAKAAKPSATATTSSKGS